MRDRNLDMMYHDRCGRLRHRVPGQDWDRDPVLTGNDVPVASAIVELREKLNEVTRDLESLQINHYLTMCDLTQRLRDLRWIAF